MDDEPILNLPDRWCQACDPEYEDYFFVEHSLSQKL